MLREFKSQKVFSKQVCGEVGRRGWAKIRKSFKEEPAFALSELGFEQKRKTLA